MNAVYSWEMAILIAAALAAGLVRGFTGGMGANAILAPVLALVAGPRQAVPIVILINMITSVQVFPGAIRLTRWREVMPMAFTGLLSVPLGIYALFNLDQDLMRRAVAVTAIVLALVLLAGWRYTGPRGPVVAAGVGGVAGFLNGAVSIGGPPVIFYLLSGPDNAATNRAYFISYTTIIQTFALAVFLWEGSFTTGMTVRTLILTVPYALAIWAGVHLFKRASERMFRHVALSVMLAVAVIVAVV